MSHDHTHNKTGNIKFAFFLNLGFTILEIAGGLWTNSLAILSDAIHDFGDSFALGQAWFFEHYSKKKGNRTFTYGYRRFSLLGAFISTILLIVSSIFILTKAIPRLMVPEPVHVSGMILFAIIGVTVNSIAVFRLKKDQGFNARVVYLHLLEDVLGWVAVLITSLVLLFKEIYILDAVLSILITVYILFSVLKNLKKTADIFLQAVPGDIRIDEIEKTLRSIDRVNDAHHTHVWSMDGDHHVLTTHVVVDNHVSQKEVLEIKDKIRTVVDANHFSHSTIEIEYKNETCRIKNTCCH